MDIVQQIINELTDKSNKVKQETYKKFFKTDIGQYGEGDKFLGTIVPDIRVIAKKYYKSISLSQIQFLVQNEYHEIRLTGLIILTYQYKNANDFELNQIYKFYLKNIQYVNNWDLVDVSAYKIIGEYLLSHTEKISILYKLAKSSNLWERRISVISTFSFIKKNKFDITIKISEILLIDKHELIHKAVGWMLREIGKRNELILDNFLNHNKLIMPRIMLRYAIEKMSVDKKRLYLEKI